MKYIVFVAVLNFSVNLLLLLGTDRICGSFANIFALLFSALVGGVYGGLCLVSELSYLAGFPYRILILALMSLIAFGWSASALRKAAVFVLLTFAVGGVVTGLGMEGFSGIVLAAAGVLILCFLGIYTRIGGQTLIPVELTYKGTTRKLMALRDTGNTLTDPVTGKQVLIVSAEIAEYFTGLTAEQLRSPLSNLEAFPGLRLIPYRTVGCSGAMLLMLHFTQVKIGGRKGSELVAFAAGQLHPDGKFQALCGGNG